LPELFAPFEYIRADGQAGLNAEGGMKKRKSGSTIRNQKSEIRNL
jgi:hypothetical protein